MTTTSKRITDKQIEIGQAAFNILKGCEPDDLFESESLERWISDTYLPEHLYSISELEAALKRAKEDGGKK